MLNIFIYYTPSQFLFCSHATFQYFQPEWKMVWILFIWFGVMLNIPVNSYGHVGMVSLPTTPFSWANLTKWLTSTLCTYSKTCVKRSHSKRPQIGFQDQLLLNAGRKFCRMLREHSAILSTFIKLPLLRSLFCLFLSGRLTQVFLYF